MKIKSDKSRVLNKGVAISLILFALFFQSGCKNEYTPICHIEIIPVSGGDYGYTISVFSTNEVRYVKNELGVENNSFKLDKEIETINLKLSEKEWSLIKNYLETTNKEPYKCTDEEGFGTWNIYLKHGDISECINTVDLRKLSKKDILKQMIDLLLKKTSFVKLNSGS